MNNNYNPPVTIITSILKFKGKINIDTLAWLLPITRLKKDFVDSLKKEKITYPGIPGLIINTRHEKIKRGLFPGKPFRNATMVCISSINDKVRNIKIFNGVLQLCGSKNTEQSIFLGNLLFDVINFTQEKLDLIKEYPTLTEKALLIVNKITRGEKVDIDKYCKEEETKENFLEEDLKNDIINDNFYLTKDISDINLKELQKVFGYLEKDNYIKLPIRSETKKYLAKNDKSEYTYKNIDENSISTIICDKKNIDFDELNDDQIVYEILIFFLSYCWEHKYHNFYMNFLRWIIKDAKICDEEIKILDEESTYPMVNRKLKFKTIFNRTEIYNRSLNYPEIVADYMNAIKNHVTLIIFPELDNFAFKTKNHYTKAELEKVEKIIESHKVKSYNIKRKKIFNGPIHTFRFHRKGSITISSPNDENKNIATDKIINFIKNEWKHICFPDENGVLLDFEKSIIYNPEENITKKKKKERVGKTYIKKLSKYEESRIFKNN